MPSSLLTKLGVRFSQVTGRPRSGEQVQMVSTGQLLLLSLKHKTKDKKAGARKDQYRVAIAIAKAKGGVILEVVTKEMAGSREMFQRSHVARVA